MANGATKELKIKLSVEDGVSRPLQDIGNNAKAAFDGVEQSATQASGGLNQVDESAQRVADAMGATVPAFSAQESAANKLDLTMRRLATANDALANETDPGKQAALRVQIDNLTQSASRYKTELDGVGKAQEQSSKSTDFMAKAIAAAGVTLSIAFVAKVGKAIIELGELGAAAQRTERAFVNISGGAGVAAGHLDAMMTATNGAISRTEAMAQASRLLQMGLVDSSESLGDFTEMAVRLGTAMGRGTNQSIEEFSLLMSNQSIMRLDTFGISAGKVRERIAELQDAFGMGREAAFMQAVEEIGTAAMERLGPAIEDNMSKIEQNRAAWADLKVETGKVFAGWVAEGASAFGSVARSLADQLILVGQLEDAYGKAAVSRAYYNTVYQYGTGEGPDLEELTDQQRQLSAETARYTGLAEHYAGLQGDITESIDTTRTAWNRYVIALGDADKGTDEYTQQLMEADFQMREVERGAEALGRVAEIKWATGQTLTKDLEDFGAQLSGLRDKAGELRSRIGELEGMSYRTSAQEGELSDLRGQLGDVRSGIDEVIAGMREMSARFVLNLIEMQISADDIITPIESAFYAGYAHQAGLIDDLALEQSALIADVVENMNLYGMTVEDALVKVLGQTDNLVDGFMKVGTAGVGSLSDIIAKGDVTIGKLMDVGLSAVAAQLLIDQMHGKDINIDVKFNIPPLHLPGGQTIETPTGDYAHADGGTIPMGGWGLVGEAGPELAQAGPGGTLITPLGGGPAPMGAMFTPLNSPTAATGGGGTWTGNMYIQGATNPRAVADAVEQRLIDRGILSQVGLR